MNPIYHSKLLSFIKQESESIRLSYNGTTELTTDEKRELLIQWLENDPRFLLDQIGSFLPQDLASCLDSDIRQEQQENDKASEGQSVNNTRIISAATRHNRRYHYLVHHLRPSGYFSEHAIQLRAPSLYEEYIGQYIPDEERYAPFEDDMTLVDRVYHSMDRRYVQDQWERKKRSEEEQYEEQDDDDEPTPLTEHPTNRLEEARQQQKEELIRLLEEQWMDGLDDQFDYTVVDNDDTYDDLGQQNQDLQDRYFDEEVEENQGGPNNDTGILDY
ncbi:coiled-coil domain-containing protein-domain-containing protein [Halteromyces radiatus]|uniref:coiled-coil domain-containing protein-domain-containing protein n=1 Tax=Halteromyces radiatus TaxID=101107 RepID=UPI00222121B2|nr:coiled-coil domain-containing protein-domain-containing protein [Halteromyces radiatus]KAI8081789.1 coiled-coil domain-containing protein-domain-containing protein [Halteromyces radiatus]